jgi:hypothetical protein
MAGHLINTLNERPSGLMLIGSTTDGLQLAEGTRDLDWFGIHHQHVYL